MSKINDLIKKLCPNGVEYKTLDKVCNINKGKQLNKDGLLSDGVYPVINGGITPSGYWNDYNYDENLITISQGGASAGYIAYQLTKFWAGAHCYVVEDCKDNIVYKYLYHFLKSKQAALQSSQVGAGIPSVSLKEIYGLKIPLPPVEVQKEIVLILDKFGEREAELEAELEARKSQYEFWHGKVFDNIDAKFVKLSDLCKIGDGLHGTPRYLDDGDYYFINGNNLMNGKIIFDEKTKKVSKTEFENQNIKLDKNTLLMSINGTIGKVSYYDDEKIMLGKSVAYFSILDEKVLSKKYLFYLLQAPRSVRYYNDSLTGSTILNLGLKALREFEIPLPPIEEQNKISNILEHFDKLINDITVGIPAEIELRRKQYEYYRNKLLTFEEI